MEAFPPKCLPPSGDDGSDPERGTRAGTIGAEVSGNVSRVAVDGRGWRGVRLLPSPHASCGLGGFEDAAPSVQREVVLGLAHQSGGLDQIALYVGEGRRLGEPGAPAGGPSSSSGRFDWYTPRRHRFRRIWAAVPSTPVLTCPVRSAPPLLGYCRWLPPGLSRSGRRTTTHTDLARCCPPPGVGSCHNPDRELPPDQPSARRIVW